MTTNDLYQHLDTLPSYQDALAHLITLSQQPKRVIIAIAGLPGSGKSTIAEYLAARATERGIDCITSVSMDGFHLSKAQLRALPDPEAAFNRRGAPWTFDSESYTDTLKSFKEQPDNTLYWPSFDHSIGDPVDKAIMIPTATKVLIVEGLYVLHRDHGFEHSQSYLDEKWYIDIPMERAMTQLAERHQQAWGFTLEQAHHRIETNDGLNAQIAANTAHNANRQIATK
ncbi:hypothetical protein ACFQ45_12245 [Rhodanobacter aciditrophus]|uniref:Phosphoribulokinase/uridine kinase domain-containing protein n=1 Tax=Rhodanobacter aciditrophus TaxID=1623218 RepID=A0ABW4B6D0_9GAMM